MPGNQPLFPKLHPGDRLPAEFLNDITGSLARIGLYADQVNGIATSAGVHRRPEPVGPRLRTFQLVERLSRTTVAEANRMVWDGTDWNEQGESVAIHGDLFRGYGFEADILKAIYDPIAARWYALGCGHMFVRGKIGLAPGGEPTELQSGGSAPLDIWEWDEDSDEWAVTDPLKTITVREAVGLDAPLATGELCFATWHEQGQFWIATLAPCPEG